ncbi:hypothetical conserved protein [Candidatus Nitrosoglobus terrae]|uniref:Hypothetical conserved protein n=1 Tax=Candidatus Nitrosoglobus terrae TaxID=1630141 RepID=A0A1Q2SNC3_9GAMM|nr:DUF2357 domain-containing protein [Candidatus Nitrosoglobus terrae]BAW80630.1 hypothetical conserved protein [Candidatus Nitrosoglobus terrae]
MISWWLKIDNDNPIELRAGMPPIEVKETGRLLFTIKINEDTEDSLAKLGAPVLIIGDIPIELNRESDAENEIIFKTSKDIGSAESRYFYNFFGESEITLGFENDTERQIKLRFNVLARKENATFAKQMLDYLTSKVEDAVAICFSRSHIKGDYSDNEKFNFNKYNLIKETVEFLREHISLFSREHKHVWKTDMMLSESGQPTGIDSIYWVLSNLDKISPCNDEGINIFYNNRGYSLPLVPKEIILEDTDTYENRVINSFLLQAAEFLNHLKREYSKYKQDIPQSRESDYVRFDHTMSGYMNITLQYKVREIDTLQQKLKEIHHLFNKILPSKVIKNIYPRFTPYVNRHFHYREMFSLITRCLKSPSPKIVGSELLLGLKNLAIIYEIVVLVSLYKMITTEFNAKEVGRAYRAYSPFEKYPFGGKKSKAPEGAVNNFYSFSYEDKTIDLYYEPKIFSLNDMNASGDLINISNNNGSKKYGHYHICPDFIIKISSPWWSASLILILDAKYKDQQSVEEYDFDSLTLKYLLNIHQLDENKKLSRSLTKVLFILFAHQDKGRLLNSVAKEYRLTGETPVLPQTIGLHFNPTDNKTLLEYTRAAIAYMG